MRINFKNENILNPPFILRGEVVRGGGLGRGVNMPTANLRVPPGADLPRHGVYASVVRFGGSEYIGLTNVGTRPTVDDSGAVTIETWLPDYDGDLYSLTIEISLRFFIREIRKFDGLAGVKAQVDADAAVARAYFQSQ